MYVRELLQNAVDAMTALHRLEQAVDGGPPGADAAGPDRRPDRDIVITCTAGTVSVRDHGIGLTLAEAAELLSTIGRSSKRDDADGPLPDAGLAALRSGFLGQFGIGLLSGFLVSDEIVVRSRSAREPAAPGVEWRAVSDGTYTVRELAPDEEPEGCGTEVTLRARRDLEHWFDLSTVTALAREYGHLLPHPVVVVGGDAPERVTLDAPPWATREGEGAAARRRRLGEWCTQAFGVRPLATIDLELPAAGLSGVAAVLPAASSPNAPATHRVSVRGMLVGDRVADLLPEWAFFVRCAVDSATLRPTASREALYEDEILLATREALGQQLRGWLARTLVEDPATARRLVEVHHLGLRALALHDEEMLRLVARWLTFETTEGPLTLAEFRTIHPAVRFTTEVADFRRLAPIARGQGIGLVNGGYVYDGELLAKLPSVLADWDVAAVSDEEVNARIDHVDPGIELAAGSALDRASAALDPLGVDVELRTFAPADVPALLMDDAEAAHQRDLQRVRGEADDVWAGILGGFAVASRRPRLLLNHANPVVGDLLAATDEDVVRAGSEALYVTAVLLAQQPLTAVVTAALNRSLGVLLRAGLSGGNPR